MKKILILLTISTCWFHVEAQYNKPYRITYNETNKAYLITNRGNGTITQVDSNFKTTTVATGLVDPRDLVIGSFAGTSGLLVVDNNQIVVYDAASYQKLIAYSVSGAKDLEDIEIDTDNPGFFYLTDKGNNSVLKGKVGPPPFYTPTYRVLSKGDISKPGGMLYAGKGQLLVVSDTANGQLIKVDTSNGKSTTLYTPGLDSLNHISKDKEGNYYLTNWGDSYLYRTSSNFDTLVKLTSYNKPAGMYINTDMDIMLLVCHLCNKLEFHRLHYAAPKANQYTCFRDSVVIDIDIQTNGIGTYNTGNKFLVEISDSLGDFTKSVTIGSITSNIKPTNIPTFLPERIYGSRHKFRVRSTNPSHSSAALDWFVQPTPIIEDFLYDSIFLCRTTSFVIGKKDDTDFEYRWSPGTYLDDSSISMPTFTATDTGTFSYKLFVENASYGCADSGSFNVKVTSDIKLSPWKSNESTCRGDTIMFGGNQKEYQYLWTPSSQLDDNTQSNPKFNADASQKYFVQVSDTATGCVGIDSVDIEVHEIPVVKVLSDTFNSCIGAQLFLEVNRDTSLNYEWVPFDNLTNPFSFRTEYELINEASFNSYKVRGTSKHGCYSEDSAFVNVTQKELFTNFSVESLGPFVRLRITADIANDVEIFWDSNGSAFTALGKLIPQKDSLWEIQPTLLQHAFYALVIDPQGCFQTSDTQYARFVGIPDHLSSTFNLYPNPASDKLYIGTNRKVSKYIIMTLDGRVLQTLDTDAVTNLGFIDIAHLSPGVFLLQLIYDDDNVSTLRFIKSGKD